MAESVEDIDDTIRHMEGRAKATWSPIVDLQAQRWQFVGQTSYVRGAVR